MTPIEEDARKNFNRKGLPKGYDPIASTHILGYTSPPVRMRPAGSLAAIGAEHGPMIAYVLAFAGLSYLALRQTDARPNPAVEAGTWMAALQQHIAQLLHAIGARSRSVRFDVNSDGMFVGRNIPLNETQRRQIRSDADLYGYVVSFRAVGEDVWTMHVSHPLTGGHYIRENPGPAFTTAQAERAGRRLGVNYARLAITPMALRVGMNAERDHSNVTHGSPTTTAKLALAHMKEHPDYYARLKKAGL